MKSNCSIHTGTKVKLILLFVLCFSTNLLLADHYYGGYYTYQHKGDLTLEVTLVTYTDNHNHQSDRDSVLFNWGDGNRNYLVRKNNNGDGEEVYPGMKKNKYVGTHTYASYANYQAYFSDNYRLFDVVNFGVGKSGVTNLRFDGIAPVQDSTQYCLNNSPTPQVDPYFYGKEGETIDINFGYYDSDGDSMSFTLTSCKGANGAAADGYFIPSTATINESTGQFTWTNPGKGKYCFSFEISEFRNGKHIGTSSTDFTLFIGHPDVQILPLGQGTNNITHHTFMDATPQKFTLSYDHPSADSITCEIKTGVFGSGGFNFTRSGTRTATKIMDTLSISYNGNFIYSGAQVVLWECTAYLGKDSVVKQVFPVALNTSKSRTWDCEIPNLEVVVENAPEIASLTISPNLFTDHVWINVGTDYESLEMYLYDVRGRLVGSYHNLAGATVKLELSHLSASMYILTVLNKESGEKVHVGKMVKKE